MLLATSCNGTLCTTAQFTSLRVVCNNILQMALRGSTGAIKVPHSTQFDAAAVKASLGVGLSHWDEFNTQTQALAARPVAPEEALRFFSDLLAQPQDEDNIILTRPVQRLNELYQKAGMGSELASTRHTAWGLVNAVTEYVDHHRQATGSYHGDANNKSFATYCNSKSGVAIILMERGDQYQHFMTADDRMELAVFAIRRLAEAWKVAPSDAITLLRQRVWMGKNLAH